MRLTPSNGSRRRIIWFLCLTTILVFLPLATNPSSNLELKSDWSYASGFNPHGPLIDRVVWIVRPLEDQASALNALQTGQYQAYDESIPFQFLPDLEATPGVEVTSELGYSYRYLMLNCLYFPTNITGYRQALAFALDKNAVAEDATGGYAEPMDGAIPISNTFWTFENQLPFHYYNKQISIANVTLDRADFIDTPDSPHPGWRYYDADQSGNWTMGDIDSDSCETEVWASAGNNPAIQTCHRVIEGLEACGLKGDLMEIDYDRLSFNWEQADFRIATFTLHLPPPGDPLFLYDFFYSKSGINQFFFGYNNSAYDYNVSRMLSAPTKLEVRNWVWNCSQILHNNTPLIPCYNEAFNHAYRTDVWEGYVNMIGMNCMSDNPWTLRKVQIKEELGGPWGSPPPIEYVLVLTEGMGTTNCIDRSSRYAAKVFSQIYSCLWQVDPYTWEKVPDLAYDWKTEETIASGDIQDGQKFTFHLYENISWHDGTPLTSEDVAYSLGTIWPFSSYYSEPYSAELVENIYLIDTPDDYTVEIYTNQSGYFEFTRCTSPYILPKHIWATHANFTSWTPETADDMTGSGPFQWVDSFSHYIIVDRYSDYHFGVDMPLRTISIPSFWIGIIVLGLIIIFIQIAIVGTLLYNRYTKKSSGKTSDKE